MSLLRGQPMRGRPDLYRGEGEAKFWEIMNFFTPRPPEIGLHGLLRRLVGEGRYADAYIAAIYWDACFDPGPDDADPTALPPRCGPPMPSRPPSRPLSLPPPAAPAPVPEQAPITTPVRGPMQARLHDISNDVPEGEEWRSG